MIDFHYWPTPNGWKVAILLEELALPYRLRMVNIGAGDQFAPEFLKISPNARMPAILDHDVEGPPVPVFESGAIMLYLAEKAGRFLPADPLGRKEALEWLFWQTGNQGPMAGQHSHFLNYAPDDMKRRCYAFERYRRETIRCLDVMERRLEGRGWLAGAGYSIADMISFPWALIMKAMEIPLDGHPRVCDWRSRVKLRPAVQRGVALAKADRLSAPHDAAARARLFGQ
ncbi:MAG: glutathione S-transferase N-terminal domain-containing protein [Paracoccaceae bacterium]